MEYIILCYPQDSCYIFRHYSCAKSTSMPTALAALGVLKEASYLQASKKKRTFYYEIITADLHHSSITSD